MSLMYQDVLTDDGLRYRVFSFKDIGTAVAAANQDCGIVAGLPADNGGTVIGVYARAGTAPAGASTQLTYDINVNATSIMSTTKCVFTAAAESAQQTTMRDDAKIYNGDHLALDCDAIGNDTAGANVAVDMVVRVDAPND